MTTLALVLTMVLNATAMSYSEARSQALFLADKMAYELELTDAQYEAVYEINLDYLMSISDNSQLYGSSWERRNSCLEYVLSAWQLAAFRAADYFFRPLSWVNGRWQWLIYSRYDRSRYYKSKPKTYSSYRGGSRQPSYYKGRTYNAPAQRRYSAPSSSKQTSQSWGVKSNKSNASKGANRTPDKGNGVKNNGKASQNDIYQAQHQYDSSRKQSEKNEKKQQKKQQKERR